jgi:peptidoglycan/LPS O-acetylase OafA/YrhL
MKITYRPEIDGLRAISILAVVIYHLDIYLFDNLFFKGGFIGVDIFFVISGYLITSLILKEININNNFSFSNFYDRRARRLLPALLFVIIIISIAGYFILLPESLFELSKSIVAAIFFIHNIYLWGTGFTYGEANLLFKPFVNLWSLSVEEQFYLFFPIFLLFIITYFKRFTFLILFCLFLFSILAANWMSKTDLNIEYTILGKLFFFFDKFNFYFIFGRIFELTSGSLLSYFEIYHIKKCNYIKSKPILKKVGTSCGILFILFSFLFFDLNSISHPSLITIVPIIGTILIIFFSTEDDLITKLLSIKLFIFFGLISYSLYLWHYPIFSYLRYLELFEQQWVKIASVILAIFLSAFSYKYIERPFRKKNIISTKKAIVIILAFITIILSYNFFIINRLGIINYKMPDILTKKFKFSIEEFANNDNGTKGTVLLIGDSHAESLAYNLNQKLSDYNFSYLHTRLYLNNFNFSDSKNKNFNKEFLNENQKISHFIKENENLIIIISQRWSQVLSEGYNQSINPSISSHKEGERNLREGLRKTFNEILKKGHQLIIVYPIPEMNFHVRRLMNKKILFNNIEKKSNNNVPILITNYDLFKKRNHYAYEVLNSLQDLNEYKVYPELIFCNTVITNACVANDKKNLFYYDSHHLSLQGSKYVVDDILNIINRIEND